MPEKRITVSGIEITVLRKKIKNMYLRVLPPDGRVQITAPLRAGDGQIRDFAQSRLTWIAAQKKRAVDRRSGWPERYETGTAMWLWGTPCRLEFQNGRAQSSGAEQQDWPGKNGGAGEFKERRIVLYADENSTQAQRGKNPERMVSRPNERSDSAGSRRMRGTRRRPGKRMAHPGYEDAMGNMQYRSIPHLAESPAGSDASGMSGICHHPRIDSSVGTRP